MTDKESSGNFPDPQARKNILAAIRAAEAETSGEIRVHIENRCRIDVLDRAAMVFKKLGMQRTAERNGVLFYIAVKDRKFAIIGDMGINAAVEEGFWDSIRDAAAVHFSQGRFEQGLTGAILACGHKLKTHFPHREDDINELSDDISFGKD